MLLFLLDITYERINVNTPARETRTPEFLAKNPNGKIPLLGIVPDQFLAESNAILYYLSQNTDYFPSDKYAQAEIM